MAQEQAAGLSKTFFVFLAGKTNGAHHDFVEKLKGVGLTEVDTPEESDYHLVFCSVATVAGMDISEALDKTPAGKPIILVVMHHTFNPDHVVAESRKLVNNPNVQVTVDCLFYEDHFLECNCNDTAWYEVRKYLEVPLVSMLLKHMIWRFSWNRFCVYLAGKTNGAHHDFVEKLKGVGQTEVNSPEECDYLLVFCPVATVAGMDIREALDKTPAGKPIILVVMHHTFNPDHVIPESRRLVNNPNVRLTVDCLFYEHRFLKCNRNDTAWLEIQKYLKV